MIIPKKSLGQNFLIDKNIAKKIVNSLIIKDKVIIEIGPGTGFLTKEILLKKPKKLILIEKDIELFKKLKLKFLETDFIDIFNSDALIFDFNKYKNIKIISNLPYNISTKLIIKLLINYSNINEMLFMVQKEVANKFIYKEAIKKNKYNLFINYLSNQKLLFNITNKVFYPKPKIQSSLIKIFPYNKLINKKTLYEFNVKIFRNKRKKISKIYNNIKYKDDKIIKGIIDKRSENLNLIEYEKLFNIF